jgi:transposase-like protein
MSYHVQYTQLKQTGDFNQIELFETKNKQTAKYFKKKTRKNCFRYLKLMSPLNFGMWVHDHTAVCRIL